MKYFVDIDETICFYEGIRNYENAIPVYERIKKINSLYEKGYSVIYWTARGTTTNIDWTDLTKAQLSDWGAKYTELRFKKPDYDIIVDDKAIHPDTFFADISVL